MQEIFSYIAKSPTKKVFGKNRWIAYFCLYGSRVYNRESCYLYSRTEIFTYTGDAL